MSILGSFKKVFVCVIFCFISATVSADLILSDDVVSTLAEKKVLYVRLYNDPFPSIMNKEQLMGRLSDALREAAPQEARNNPFGLSVSLEGPLGKGLYASRSIVSVPYDGLLLEVEVSPGLRYVDLTDSKVLDYFKKVANTSKIEDIYRFINNIESEVAFRVAPIAPASGVLVHLENIEWVFKSTEELSISLFSLKDKSLAKIRALLRPVFNELHKPSNEAEQNKVVLLIKGFIQLSQGFSDVVQLIRVFYASPDYWETLSAFSQDRVMQALVKRGVTSVQSGVSLFVNAHSGNASDTTEAAKKSEFTLDVNIFSERQLLMILGETVRYIDSVAAGIFLLKHISFIDMLDFIQDMRNKIVSKILTRIESVEDAVALLEHLKKVSPRYYNVKQVQVVGAVYSYVRSEQDRAKLDRVLSGSVVREYLSDLISWNKNKCSATFK